MAARPHLLLDHRAGWRAAELSPTVEVDPDGRLALRPRPGGGRPLVDAAGSFGGLTQPTGVAVDAGGTIYLADAGTHRVLRYDPCTCCFEALPCVGGPGSQPRELRAPRGLAVSRSGDLIVADTGNRRLQIFALKGLALRALHGPYRVERQGEEVRLLPAAPLPAGGWPPGTWQPWDLALAGCRLWISDPDNGLVHGFDLRQSRDARARQAITITEESPGVSLERPTHLAVDRAGRLYVVQEGRDHVAVFDRRGRPSGRVELPRDLAGRFCPSTVAVDPEGVLYLTCCDGSRRGEERVCLYRPPGRARGVAAPTGALLDRPCRVVAFDPAGRPLALSGSRLLLLDPAAAFETEGRYVSEALDSRTARCPWHRVVLAGEVAPGTRARVETFTSESPKSADEIAELPESRWQPGADYSAGTAWDCLVRSAPGRYLWLRLTLAGDGGATPVLTQARVEFPRASSLRFLPAVYQQDPQGRDFLDRFLALLDGVRDEIGDTLDDIAGLFDPAATPAGERSDFLTWLASWVGLSLDRQLPVARRRRLLAAAHRLWALRGTPEGLRLHLRLYSGAEPRLLEHFRARRWLHLGSAGLGDSTQLWGADVVRRLQLDVHSRIGEFQLLDSGDPVSDPVAQLAHRFTVYLPALGAGAGGAAGGAEDQRRRGIRRLVEVAKPAHTDAEVVFVEPLLRIGVQARVGVDTVVGRYPEGVTAGATELGRGSVLGPSADEATSPTLRVGIRSRLGSSTLID